MIIAVDFDGTLHDGEFPHIGKAKRHAIEVMRKLREAGHTIIIWTCREGLDKDLAVNWLTSHDIPFDHVNSNEPEHMKLYDNDCRKVYADIYVDDHQVGGLPSWRKIYRYIRRVDRQMRMRRYIDLTGGIE
jgi:hypothetical protein